MMVMDENRCIQEKNQISKEKVKQAINMFMYVSAVAAAAAAA